MKHNDNNFDKLILLLSTDWFSNYIYIVFGSVSSKQKDIAIEVCRNCVKDFMAGNDIYWNIPFSEERVNKTKSAFLIGLKKAGIKLLESFGGNVDSDNNTIQTIWLVRMITEELIENKKLFANLDIDASSVEKFKKLYRESQTVDFSVKLEEACLSSSTKWDLYIRSVTPDLPKYTYLFAKEIIRDLDGFSIFWVGVKNSFSENQIGAIKNWYSSNIISLSDKEFIPKYPPWF